MARHVTSRRLDLGPSATLGANAVICPQIALVGCFGTEAGGGGIRQAGGQPSKRHCDVFSWVGTMGAGRVAGAPEWSTRRIGQAGWAARSDRRSNSRQDGLIRGSAPVCRRLTASTPRREQRATTSQEVVRSDTQHHRWLSEGRARLFPQVADLPIIYIMSSNLDQARPRELTGGRIDCPDRTHRLISTGPSGRRSPSRPHLRSGPLPPCFTRVLAVMTLRRRASDAGATSGPGIVDAAAIVHDTDEAPAVRTAPLPSRAEVAPLRTTLPVPFDG